MGRHSLETITQTKVTTINKPEVTSRDKYADLPRESRDALYGRSGQRRRIGFIAGTLAAGATIGTVVAGCTAEHHVPRAKTTPAVHKVSVPERTPLKHFQVAYANEVLNCTVAAKPYTVEPGDNLWTITEEHNGGIAVAPAWRGHEVLNAKVLGANPDLIFPGEELQVFADCTLK